jgi:hypothetical protein
MVGALRIGLIASGLAWSEDLAIQLRGVTSTQAVLQYVSPVAGPCAVEVVEEETGALVNDVNVSLFAEANLDVRPGNLAHGAWRTAVIGRRTSEAAANGRYYSRALQAFTAHRATVHCGTASGTVAFRTTNPPAGNTNPELPGFAPDRFGHYAWPTIDWANKNTRYIDPLTGILVKRATGPGESSLMESGRLFAAALDRTGSWVDPDNALAGGTTALAETGGTDPLFLALGSLTSDFLSMAGFSVDSPSLDDIRERACGMGSDSDPSNRTFEVCLSVDSGQSCASETVVLVAPEGTPGTIPSPNAAMFPAAPFGRWGGVTLERALTSPTAGRVDVDGELVTLRELRPQMYFQLGWVAGTKIHIEGSAPICAGNLCTIAEVLDSRRLRLEESLTLSDAAYRAANVGLRVRKTTAVGTLAVSFSYDLASSRMFNNPSNASSDFCSRKTVTAMVNAAGAPSAATEGMLCVLSTTGGPSALYFFAPATGEIRLLSNFFRPYAGFGGDEFGSVITVRSNSFDATDGRVFYGVAETGNGPFFTTIWKGRYEGDFREWKPGYQNPPPPDQVVWQNLTPASEGRDVKTQLRAKNSRYDPAIFTTATGLGLLGEQYVFWVRAQQETPCIIAVFSLATGDLTFSKDSWSDYPGRWGVCHTIQPLGQGPWLISTINAARFADPTAPLAGPFYIDVANIWKNGEWSTDTSISANAAETCPVDIDERWKQLGATGNNCLRLRIAGEPCSATATALEKERYPCPHDPNQSMLQTIEPGDLFSDFSSTCCAPFHERLRVVKKTIHAPNLIELYVQRRAYCATEGTSFLPNIFFQYANGWRASMAQPGGCWGAGWWLNTAGGPPVWVLEDPALTASHNDYGVGFENNSFTGIKGAYDTRQDLNSRTFGQPLGNAVNGWPTFAGSTAVIRGNGLIETYPSMRQWNAPPGERSWALDLRAYQIGIGVGGEVPLALYHHQIALVEGETRIYKASNTLSGFDRKRLPYLGWAGRYWLKDLSGPGSTIGNSDIFSFCVADRAGECRAESAVNDVYLNVPKASIDANPFCSTNHYSSNFPCFGTASPVGAWAVQWDVSRSDDRGAGMRRISMGFSGPGRQYTFANARATPDGKWALLPGYWLDGYRLDLLMAKLPPWPMRQSTDRSDFIAVTQKLPVMAGVSRVRIRYGYAENGAPADFYCTPRREACLATSSSSEPFAWEAEAPAEGLDCASGCQIRLRALPGRVLYYQVERLAANGAPVMVEPIQTLAIP